MVMPRSRSSGALSIESNGRNSAPPRRARVLVMAAVSVVLPWSMCPMVPTFTCGLVRSNFFFATLLALPVRTLPCVRPELDDSGVLALESPPRGSNPRPRPYQGRALPTELGGRSLTWTVKRGCSPQPLWRLTHTNYRHVPGLAATNDRLRRQNRQPRLDHPAL